MEIRGLEAWLTDSERLGCEFFYSGSWAGKMHRFAREAAEKGCFWLCAAAVAGTADADAFRFPLYDVDVVLGNGVEVQIRAQNRHDDHSEETVIRCRWRTTAECVSVMRFVPEPLREEVLSKARAVLQARADEAARDVEKLAALETDSLRSGKWSSE